ncbi:hypothetical protein [Halorussus aquaticus]|nr:hypothetical protein [Halorussus aquaticus]
MTNYSIRIDDDLRDDMKDIPDMADRIRQFIRREVQREKYGSNSPTEQFLHDHIDEYGIVGAYCLTQLSRYIRSEKRYIDNVETRFADTDVDLDQARLDAKRIREHWNDENIRASDAKDAITDVLDRHGYYDEFRQRAVDRIQNADEMEQQLFWTAYQLRRDRQERHQSSFGKTATGAGKIQTQGFKDTLIYGFNLDESDVDQLLNSLIEAGAVRGYYSSNAYGYNYIRIPGYLFDAFAEGLDDFERDVRSTIRSYCEEDPYLDDIEAVTHGEDDLYRNQQVARDDHVEQDHSDTAARLINDGAVIIRYRSRRSSTGGRSSKPARRTYILAPDVRQIVGDAFYERQTA